MIENNNKAVIKKLAKESFKANKSRNKFAILSIVLTTLLFTVIFTIGMSMVKSSEYSTMRMVGTTFHGGFKNLTNEEYEKLRNNKLIKEQGKVVMISLAENKEFAKRQIEIKYGDKDYINNSFATPIKGKLPQNKDEILVDTLTLDMLGLPHNVNQQINLKYKINKKEHSSKFTVSGIYEGDIVSMASTLYVSKEFTQNVLANIDKKQAKENSDVIGLVDLNVNFSNSLFIENKLVKVIQESGLSVEKIATGVNWAYVGGKSSIDLGTISGVIGIILLIMVTGYLIIYNIFYISIVRDTKFYGLLKTIGTTKKQIKKIIIRQALILSSIGIPIGIILGYSLGIILLPVVMSTLVIPYTKISINPIIFIGSVLFSLMTVLISAYKPAKIASKISPIEAVRYSGVNENTKRKYKKSSNGARLNRMALANIFKNKKKALVVITSLSLSIILLNAVYTFVSGFDIDKYLIKSIGTDFTIGDASFYRWNFDSSNLNSVTEELCNKIEKIDGVRTVDKIYHRKLLVPLNKSMEENLSKAKDGGDKYLKESLQRIKNTKMINAMYYGIDKGIYDLLKNYIVEGKFDIDKFESGSYIIAEKEWEVGYETSISKSKVGDKITIPLENGENKEYEVMAIVDNIPLYLRIGYSYGGLGSFTGYLPTKEFKNTTSNDSIMTAMFNVNKESSKKKVEYLLDSSVSSTPSLDYRSKSTYVNEFNGMIKSYEIIGYGLSFIIGLIGLLNFANVMITSIVTRRKELAMLKSIGMTQKQVKKMINLESLYYVFITIGVVIIIGLPLTYFIVNLIGEGMNIFSYKFTLIPLLISIPILLMIAIVIPIICFNKEKKVSIIEALTENE